MSGITMTHAPVEGEARRHARRTRWLELVVAPLVGAAGVVIAAFVDGALVDGSVRGLAAAPAVVAVHALATRRRLGETAVGMLMAVAATVALLALLIVAAMVLIDAG